MHLVVTYNRYRLNKVECVVRYRAFSAGRKAEQGRVRGIDGGRKVSTVTVTDNVLAALQAGWTHAQGSRVHPLRPLGAADTGRVASCRMGFVRFSNAITKIGSGQNSNRSAEPLGPCTRQSNLARLHPQTLRRHLSRVIGSCPQSEMVHAG
jgi:hypothetical protein